jgi:hypothetical protein
VASEEEELLEHGHLPDPVGLMIANLTERLERLESRAEKTQVPPGDPVARLHGG